MSEGGIERGNPRQLASEILASRNVAVFHVLPDDWVIAQDNISLKMLLDPYYDILGSQTLMTALSAEYGGSGWGILLPPNQDRLGPEASVKFIVPNTEYVPCGAERTLANGAVMRIVVNNPTKPS